MAMRSDAATSSDAGSSIGGRFFGEGNAADDGSLAGTAGGTGAFCCSNGALGALALCVPPVLSIRALSPAGEEAEAPVVLLLRPRMLPVLDPPKAEASGCASEAAKLVGVEGEEEVEEADGEGKAGGEESPLLVVVAVVLEPGNLNLRPSVLRLCFNVDGAESTLLELLSAAVGVEVAPERTWRPSRSPRSLACEGEDAAPPRRLVSLRVNRAEGEGDGTLPESDVADAIVGSAATSAS